uniref:Uncharacterized protein n=2 Tax=Vibrionaceae TaxID=641 RepID=A0A0H4A3R3_9VIBR|nr:hypothetical protein [Vibrio tasmaniensis]
MKAIGYIYEHMVRVFPDKPWVKAYSNIYGGGQTPSLPKVMDNFLVQGLYIFETKHESRRDQYEIGLIEQSMSLCNAFLGMYHSLVGIEQDNCLKRFQAAFHKPNDLRAIDFELFCYLQLHCNNCSVEVKDGDNSGDNFDYLITDHKGLQVQLECKSFAYSKGLYVPGEDAARLYNRILSLEHGLGGVPDNQLRIYTIELKKELPKGEESLNRLAEQIICTINDESYVGNELFCVQCEIFNNVENIEESDRTLHFNSGAVGIEVGRVASLSKGGRGRFSLILNSAVKESALFREFETIC